MYTEKNNMYRIRYYPQFQVSTRGLGMYSCRSRGVTIHDSHPRVLLASGKSREQGAISLAKEGKTIFPWFNLSEKVVMTWKHPLVECWKGPMFHMVSDYTLKKHSRLKQHLTEQTGEQSWTSIFTPNEKGLTHNISAIMLWRDEQMFSVMF